MWGGQETLLGQRHSGSWRDVIRHHCRVIGTGADAFDERDDARVRGSIIRPEAPERYGRARLAGSAVRLCPGWSGGMADAAVLNTAEG